jgi:hypothetical protein
MVRAILRRRDPKTQTRRVIKCKYHGSPDPFFASLSVCLYGSVGDRLWVRETFRLLCFDETETYQAEFKSDGQLGGKPVDWASQEAERFSYLCGSGWRPSIHMPRWASRITLQITDVRVQRLHEISEEDARAEGCELETFDTASRTLSPETYRHNFRLLWDSINAKRGCGWDVNPWVWAISFERVKE